VIAIHTSALMAIVLDEAEADRCSEVLVREPKVLISAGTLVEALVVAQRRRVTNDLTTLIENLDMTEEPVSEAVAHRVAEAYGLWGKGFHPAGLNWGDCFAYVTAKDCGRRLLFVGDDFARTDLIPA